MIILGQGPNDNDKPVVVPDTKFITVPLADWENMKANKAAFLEWAKEGYPLIAEAINKANAIKDKEVEEKTKEILNPVIAWYRRILKKRDGANEA